MRWLKRDIWKVGIALAGLLLLLTFMVWISASLVRASERTSELAMAGTPTIQATPTEDATVTSLNKEKLQHENNWLWSNGATILTSLISTITLAAAGIFTVVRYFNDRKDAREKQEAESKRLAEERKTEQEKRDQERQRWLKDQEAEREKRDEERFQAVVDGLSSLDEPKKVGAAIMLRTFLRAGYERFYPQTFDLAVAHLRLHRMVSNEPENPDDPLPITTLSYALIAVFREVFPHVRDSTVVDKEKSVQTLDATGVQLDSGYLAYADLKGVWMPNASLRGANLESTNFKEATLTNADFRKAQFRFTNFTQANLEGANLSGISSGQSITFRLATLTNADLHDADLSQNAVFTSAHLRYANLIRANLKGAVLACADFSGADLTGADLSSAIFQVQTGGLLILGTHFRRTNLSEANFNGADMEGVYLEDAILRGTKMHNVRSLTKEQLEDFKARGAIIDEATMANTSQSTVSPPVQNTNIKALSASSVPSTEGSSASVSQQSNDAQTQSATAVQVNTPPPGTDRNSSTSAQPSAEP